MIPEKYPYTDLHELNLDYILEQLRTQAEEIKTLKEQVEELDERVTALGG